jgi:uncharacterized protein YjbI with pentapeptide repeats
MPEAEHLEILKQGTDVWNQWREEKFYVRPNLRGADLRDVDVSKVYLGEADLTGVDLRGRDLSHAQLYDVDLTEAKLNNAKLVKADLTRAILYRADLMGANLLEANLQAADLRDADLAHASLRGSFLGGVIFTGCNLSKADISESNINGTTFGDNDLRDVIGLDSVIHGGPSVIGVNTIYRSQGEISEAFLRGCGVPETFITYGRALVRPAIEFYSCFISYSSKDQTFAERLYHDLQARGVRCWFAPEAIGIGGRFRDLIDETIRVYDKLLVILSKHSIRSTWVEREVETALEVESSHEKQVLFPLRLDDEVMEADREWLVSLRRSRHIGDFREWRRDESYQRALSRLLRDLTLSGTEIPKGAERTS